MDEPWEHYTKCNESDRQIPYDLFHMWNQKQNKTKLQAYRYRGKWGFVTEMRVGEWVKQRRLLEDFLVGSCLQDATVLGAVTDDLAIY